MKAWSVYKFGGASVKDAEALQNAVKLVRDWSKSPLVMVVSAMGKTTNALENYLQYCTFNQKAEAASELDRIKNFHEEIAKAIGVWQPALVNALDQAWKAVEGVDPNQSYGIRYDATISVGEIVSSLILQAALQKGGIEAGWLDARKLVKTNADHRRAVVDWEATEAAIQQALSAPTGIYVTQGFIASGPEGQVTTLGREGSDYTAAIFAYALSAVELTIWKDVQGVLSGDPKVFDQVELLREIPYTEAIELAFYGASVIHPKTIQPLQGRGIVLHVRSFLHPALPATRISGVEKLEPEIPCWIVKQNQAVFTVGTHDLSFLSEGHLAEVYKVFSDAGLLVNLAQHAAVSSRFCVTADRVALPKAQAALSAQYRVSVEEGLSLYTVRRPHEATRTWLAARGDLRFEQRSGSLEQVVLKEKQT